MRRSERVKHTSLKKCLLFMRAGPLPRLGMWDPDCKTGGRCFLCRCHVTQPHGCSRPRGLT